MSLPAMIRAARDAGVSADQIVDMVLAVEDERLAKGRARTAKSRNINNNSDVTPVTPVTQKERKEPKERKTTNPPKEKPLRGSKRKTPLDELSVFLDAERALAVIEHRKQIKKPLTAHAAKLLGRKFSDSRDANTAADAMIANGWQGFEPSWLENRIGGTDSRAPPGSFRKEFKPERKIDQGTEAEREAQVKSHGIIKRAAAGMKA